VAGDEGTGPAEGFASAWRMALLVAFALAGAGLLAALIVTQGRANRERDQALALQSHSYDVMVLARTLSGTVARAEASLGRYVISTDRQLGQLYSDEWRRAGHQIDRLDQITADSTAQQRRVDRLREAFAERGAELSATALATAYNRNNQALSRYYRSRDADSLRRLDAQLDAIIRHERGLLDQRSASVARTIDRSTSLARVLGGFGIVLVLGAVALGWFIVQARHEQQLARADAEEERERALVLAAAVTAATDELRMQEARLRQVQKMDAVGQLTGGIAHDFNNMLAVVLGGLELARRAVPGSAQAALRHIDSATEGANRAAALTRRLLAFSREESLAPEPIQPATLIAGMSDLLDRTLGDRITVVVEDTLPRGWGVHADRVQLENALLNLAVNARDAMDGHGRLTIRTAAATLADGDIATLPAGDYVALAVTDTGCGMTDEVIERAFEPFFTTKPAGKGTGLGLSQIFGLVRSLGGDVTLASMPGEGTTVTLFLPRRHLPPVLAPVVEPLPAADAPVAPEPGRPLTVLVVEDDPRVLAATLGALDELGHRAIPCNDPLAAPAMLAAEPVDLVISDVLMPGQTGPEMIAALDGRQAEVAVLFVTGFAGETGMEDLGGRPVLRKPFTLGQLERAVADAVAARPPLRPEYLAAE
jgi:signal transduction histidine kinase/ActR/RegA family two-component response regulator